MSWSSANTNCCGSLTFLAPIPLNLLITADVLSCVMQPCGRMDRKSPVRNSRLGPSVMCVCAIFSVMVWPMMNSCTALVPVNNLVVEIACHFAARVPIEVNERGGKLDNSHCDAHHTQR